MKKLLLRCTCPNCDAKHIREMQEEIYEAAKEGLKVIQNRILLLCVSCESFKLKALLKTKVLQ